MTKVPQKEKHGPLDASSPLPHENCFLACGTTTSNQVTGTNGARHSKQIQISKKPGCYCAVILASTKNHRQNGFNWYKQESWEHVKTLVYRK